MQRGRQSIAPLTEVPPPNSRRAATPRSPPRTQRSDASSTITRHGTEIDLHRRAPSTGTIVTANALRRARCGSRASTRGCRNAAA